MQNKTSNKNGKIELLRFIFSLYVLLFHGGKYFLGDASLSHGVRLSFFCHGAMGVEFFFLVSGFLMAKSAYKLISNKGYTANRIGHNTVGFLKRKISGILPEHILTFVLATVSYIILKGYAVKDSVVYAVSAIPNLFLVQMLGFKGTEPNHIEWYLSVMLIAMFLLYPLLIKNYEFFVRWVAPVVSLLILGYMSFESGSLTGVKIWTGVCYKSLLRGIAEISLGTVAFELCRVTDEITLSKTKKLCLSTLELFSFITITVLVIFTFPKQCEYLCLVLIFILVTTSFSKKTYHPDFLDTAPIMLLGKFSLPLYLCQVPAINLVKTYLNFLDPYLQILCYSLISVILASVVLGLCTAVRAGIKKHSVHTA